MGMLAEREKRLLRTITGGGQAVGAEPYPGKKGNQGYVLTRLLTEWIQRGTEQSCADRLHIRRPPHTLRRRARGEHTRSPPRVSGDFQMHVHCGCGALAQLAGFGSLSRLATFRRKKPFSS